MEVRGITTGTIYRNRDIMNDNKYSLMNQEEALIDNDGDIVFSVRNISGKVSAHFRKDKTSNISRIGRREVNPSHNDCVNELHRALSQSIEIEIFTYLFKSKTEKENIVIFKNMKDSGYSFHREEQARIPFEGSCYIQPDIGGIAANRLFPSTAYPGIIVEVIRTHEPELETFRKLFELSRMNYLIIFYFIDESKKSSILNSFTANEEKISLRVSHYMQDRKLYKNGISKTFLCDGEVFEDWYNGFVKTYFKKAKEKIN
jgi:hypothetical protein